jgi:hypothetical protein
MLLKILKNLKEKRAIIQRKKSSSIFEEEAQFINPQGGGNRSGFSLDLKSLLSYLRC